MTSLRTRWPAGPVMPLEVPAPIPVPVAEPFHVALARVPLKRQPDVIKAVRAEAATRYGIKRQAMLDSLGFLADKTPYEWLRMFLEKPWAVWQEQGAKFPRSYETDWQYFQQLQQRATDGDFDKEDGGLARTLVAQYQRLHPVA